jgi:hypothetical protein
VKVLFLDCDGVINSAQWFAAQKAKGWLGLAEIDPEAVARVQRVVAETGATIVLSSTWRCVPDFVTLLRTVGGLTIEHFTPRLDTNHRASEIAAWIEAAPEKPDAFAIIDDDADAGDHPALRPFFVQTTWERGMLDEHERALIALLGRR